MDGEVAENLPVFGQIKILQAVLLLTRSTLFHELLLQKTAKQQDVKICLIIYIIKSEKHHGG